MKFFVTAFILSLAATEVVASSNWFTKAGMFASSVQHEEMNRSRDRSLNRLTNAGLFSGRTN